MAEPRIAARKRGHTGKRGTKWRPPGPSKGPPEGKTSSILSFW